MKFDTGFGTLELPCEKCVICIARNQYMACTACEFKETMIEHAVPMMNKMNEDLNNYIREHPEAIE